MPVPDLVKTSIGGLDEILSGGIPRGNVILLESEIGCGKTTMGVEFVYRGITEFGVSGIILVFEVAPDMIARDALGFGWDLRELERADRLRIVFTSREVLRQELQQADSVRLDSFRLGMTVAKCEPTQRTGSHTNVKLLTVKAWRVAAGITLACREASVLQLHRTRGAVPGAAVQKGKRVGSPSKANEVS